MRLYYRTVQKQNLWFDRFHERSMKQTQVLGKAIVAAVGGEIFFTVSIAAGTEHETTDLLKFSLAPVHTRS